MTPTECTPHPKIDDTVVVAFFIDGRPLAVSALVTSDAPLALFTRDGRVEGLELPRNVVLVWHRDQKVMKGDAHAVSVKPWRTGFLIEIERTDWVDVDRRVYPRVALRLPVNLRAVHDTRGTTVISVYQGTTDDLSLGGAWVTVSPVVAMGSLVECQVTLEDGAKVSTFALVAHESTTRGGIGVEFLDFIGDARERLEAILPLAA